MATRNGLRDAASEHANAELFWELRGAGANFGIVTELELRLHPVSQVVAGMLFHPAERLADALRFYALKRACDPESFFRMNKNIKP